jgi:hypothetical protein
MSTISRGAMPEAPVQRRFPPVAEIGTAALVLVVIGGIFMASYAPRRPPLGIPTALLVVSGALLLSNAVVLARIREFAWDRFFQVFRWALLSYVIAAGLIGYAFARNHTRGGPLLLISLMLVVFAVDVPMIISFTVARYQAVKAAGQA